MGFFDDLRTQAVPFFTNAAIAVAQQRGINIGGSSPQAQTPPPIQGVPNQAPQPVYATGAAAWYRRPIVIVAAVIAVVALSWSLLRKR